jgi:prepilin-type N-terminal cleavage/methylation domain-containing protein
MISLKQRNKGFTIVELLIVIVVIGILALLVITTYGGIQQKARNSKRQADVQAIQTQLEAFYNQNGYYPSRTNMNDSSWRSTNMKSLDSGALTDPKSSTASMAASPAANTYAYAVTATGGAACETDATTCAEYTLTATYEGQVNNQTTFVKRNLN